MADKGNLLKDIEIILGVKSKLQCTIAYMLGRVSDSEREAIVALLDHSLIDASKVAALFTSHGFPMSKSLVNRHRGRLTREKDRCKCARESESL